MPRQILSALMVAACSLAAAPLPALTADGLAPVRIGMTQAQIEQATGMKLDVAASEDNPGCADASFAGWPGISLLLEHRRLTVIEAGGHATGLRTVDGIRIGTTESDLRRRFGARAVFNPRPYEGDSPEAHEVVVRLKGMREFVFETYNNVVDTIRVGDEPSAEYAEGCE